MVRIDLGEDIIESLKKLCADEHIRLGRVEAIGATDHAVIGVYDLKQQAYVREELNGFMEITALNGNAISQTTAFMIYGNSGASSISKTMSKIAASMSFHQSKVLGGAVIPLMTSIGLATTGITVYTPSLLKVSSMISKSRNTVI